MKIDLKEMLSKIEIREAGGQVLKLNLLIELFHPLYALSKLSKEDTAFILRLKMLRRHYKKVTRN